MIRILVVNDSPSARAAIRFALAAEADFSIVKELESAHAAADEVKRLEPDVGRDLGQELVDRLAGGAPEDLQARLMREPSE